MYRIFNYIYSINYLGRQLLREVLNYSDEYLFEELTPRTLKKMHNFLVEHKCAETFKEIKSKNQINIKGCAPNGLERLIGKEIREQYGLDILEASEKFTTFYPIFSEGVIKYESVNGLHYTHFKVSGQTEKTFGKGIDKALMPYVFTSAVGLVGKTLESNFVGRMNEFGVSQTPQVFIDCQVMDDLEGLRIFWDVREGIFPDGLVEDMFFLFGKQIDKMEKECFWTQEDIVEFRYLIEYMRLDNKGTIAGIAIKNSKRYCEMNPDNLIEILADEYVNLIIGLNKKKIQIIGYCISGLIAVEIARRLMERGLEIFDLVLIDSHPIQYQLEDELLMEITFLPSLGIEISQLGLGEISNEELYKAVLYLYNEFKKEIPSRSIQYLPDEYINLKKILLKLDCMEKRQRFELYSKMALEKAENQFPVDMCIDLFAAYKQSFKAAQFVPEVYAGNIRFLLAEESTSFIPDNDEETLAFWKNTCLDDMSVEMIKGNHITCTENKENACTLCKKISKCFQD